MKLIGLAGPAGSGKSSAADAILSCIDELNMQGSVYGFSYPLKEAVTIALLGGRALSSNVHRPSQAQKDSIPWPHSLTYREILQKFGTEVARNIDPQFWINCVKQRFDDWSGVDFIILDDVRYENEAHFIRSFPGRIIHVNRPNNPIVTPPHSSEKGVDRYRDDWIIHNDGTEAEFKTKCRQLTPGLLTEVMKL